MSTGIVRSLGVGRHIDWRAINSKGAAGGVLVFGTTEWLICWRWKKDVFSVLSVQELYGWDEVGIHRSLWPVCRRDREVFWESLGQ
ncbi:hypothetical protein CK203_068314 [Vitis vinifera]|uniref:Uncharacterized protein n=1 Tax=Vitis vinifera TaxID=29760 RepID=A0A438F390_VITVI|nr:hypothetical protein CK203_068314 [Vitis vinifera]